jgi:hypothetical protein
MYGCVSNTSPTSSTAPPATTFPEKVCQRFANVLPTVCIPVANVESRIPNPEGIPRQAYIGLSAGCQRRSGCPLLVASVLSVFLWVRCSIISYMWTAFRQFFFGRALLPLFIMGCNVVTVLVDCATPFFFVSIAQYWWSCADTTINNGL